MQQAIYFAKALGEMPFPALGALVIVSAFALSAWAIYAVMRVSKGNKNAE